MRTENPLKYLNAIATIFLLGFFVFVLMELQSILLPFFIAIIISFVFLPFYNFLLEKKIPVAVSIIIVVLTIFVLSNIASLFIFTSFKSFSAEFPKYEAKFLQIYESVIAALNMSPEETENLNNLFDVKKLLIDGSLTSVITSLFSSITKIMGDYLIILFYVIFILSEAKSIQNRVSTAFTAEHEITVNKTFSDIVTGVKDYISGKTLLSFTQAVIIGIFLGICGVDFYFIWAFMFFLTDFIPNIGSLLSTSLVGIVMFLQFDNVVTPIVIIIVLILIQNVKGNIIEPKIFGAKLDLSPLLLFFSLIFWGYIWGVVGMILSVPIMSIIKIIFMNIPATKHIAILMSNNPTGTKT